MAMFRPRCDVKPAPNCTCRIRIHALLLYEELSYVLLTYTCNQLPVWLLCRILHAGTASAQLMTRPSSLAEGLLWGCVTFLSKMSPAHFTVTTSHTW